MGLTITLEVEGSDTIESVKAKIHASNPVGWPQLLQHLAVKFAGRLLDGDATVADCNILSGSTLELVADRVH